MRLTHVKLAGFKSFVDPTNIGTPGQLVGIVGPNGCGKSNVIDAVRWVLGESKASALRGESMQDVIFNGAGERKPVGRASVELVFDNSAGRIGGQWGQFVELSIKRVLTRTGDSNYYINNIPVRRRDIHDLFLGTGLGPRAYAIIEQGMISRIIEARPEELRIFLEEAAGVSKYKERRKETEGRLSDTRENLARVEDIRMELGNQLARLTEQARLAGEYRELEARLKTAQHLSWFGKQQDAARARERHANEGVTLANALEAIRAEVRHAESALEHLRNSHYAANDTVHERQAAFYSANAEVTRLEQQLAYARESESRLAEQLAELSEQVAGLGGQQSGLAGEREGLAKALADASAARERTATEEEAARAALPALEDALAEATLAQNELQKTMAALEQDIRIGETQRDNHARTIAQHRDRHGRLEQEILASVTAPTDVLRDVEEQLEQERADLAEREARLSALAQAVQTMQAEHRTASDHWQAAGKTLADVDARRQALASLQARIGHGEDIDAWCEAQNLAGARQLWQLLDVQSGWEDAVEAVLRERLKGLQVDDLAEALAWLARSAPPARLAVFSATPDDHALHAAPSHSDGLLAKIKVSDAQVSRVVADAVAHVRCRPDLATALADRQRLAVGESYITPQGNLVTATGIVFFAPDSEIHGVIARAREIGELDGALPALQDAAGAARIALEAIETALKGQQQDYHGESQAMGSQQRRVHDLELELVELRKEAEARARRHAELAAERDAAAAALAAEQSAHDVVAREIADHQSRQHEEAARRDAARHARNERDVALARGRESLRLAERATQEAGFAERSARDRMAELERRGAALETQIVQQRGLLDKLGREQQSIDWTPVEEALQRQLGVRGETEQALASARDAMETLSAQLRAGDEARMLAEQKLEPARVRIQEMQLKEQAALLAEEQFTGMLVEAQVDLTALPEALKAWGRASLPAEITRLTAAIAELGAVNLAALDELTQSQERKDYLDSQSADLNEALTTLESAIRQIDRESRELLRQTFEAVNRNFAELFPMLFGGGQARLVLTGEEILDSGVQVVAQPPGKRNTSIHLLSGGEKALTAIALVFSLFQLNPAPFCLLDEVDAPLDDPNTERFCRMVKKMSAETQFLFISHNKITMEMANQLIGITMPDPGVSRVVAVDIAEALTLAEATTAAAA